MIRRQVIHLAQYLKALARKRVIFLSIMVLLKILMKPREFASIAVVKPVGSLPAFILTICNMDLILVSVKQDLFLIIYSLNYLKRFGVWKNLCTVVYQKNWNVFVVV